MRFGKGGRQAIYTANAFAFSKSLSRQICHADEVIRQWMAKQLGKGRGWWFSNLKDCTEPATTAICPRLISHA
jgi:hypothetical protein